MPHLATGVALSAYDRTPGVERNHRSKIFPAENALNQAYLVALKDDIAKVAAYSEYRDLILIRARTDTSRGMTESLDKIVNFYEGYIACRTRWQCSPSKQLEANIVDIWYTCRPILEERRVDLWGPATLSNFSDTPKRSGRRSIAPPCVAIPALAPRASCLPSLHAN